MAPTELLLMALPEPKHDQDRIAGTPASFHPFIVAEMKPLLEHSGYAAAKPESLTDFAAQARTSAGVVISLAVPSSLGESAAEVFTRLRREVPHVPVLFAAMLPLDVVAGNENAAALGKPETFLYDLADTGRRAIGSRMVQRHFR